MNVDLILDLKDVINSLDYCLENTISKTVRVDRKSLIDELEKSQDIVLKEVKQINSKIPNIEKSIEKNESTMTGDKLKKIEKVLKKRMATHMATVYKIDQVDRKLKEINNSEIKISQHVHDYFKDVRIS